MPSLEPTVAAHRSFEDSGRAGPAAQRESLVGRRERTMSWLVRNFKWVMLASGLLTLTMVQAAVAPQAALRSTFGDSLEGPLAEIVVRNWGALVALIGAMLIYGAFRPQVRDLVLAVAGLSKLVFISLVLAYGTQYLGRVGVPVAVDFVMVLLFITYLAVSRRADTAA
jgi:hypothetical protein